MKRLASVLLALCQIALSLLLLSCEQRGDFLFYQREAFCASVTFSAEERTVEGTLCREKDGARRFSFTAPDALSGISLLADTEGRYFLSYEGMTEKVSGQAEALLAAFDLLSLTPSGRIRYLKDGAVFPTEGGQATVKTGENGYPLSVTLQSEGGKATLTIAAWEVLP